jgi:SEC-C motif-containing protein
MTPRPCPCGRPRALADCCGRFLAGAAAPDTAEDLMRSRYTAYVEGAVDWLVATTAADERRALDRKALADYCRGLRGVSLEILAVVDGEAFHETGEVTFAATLRARGRTFVQRERSRFHRERGRWVYAGGDVLP